MTTVVASSLSEARRIGAEYYTLGKPCKYGHTSKRLTANRTCLECCREKALRKRVYDIEHRPAYAARKRELRKLRWKEREALAASKKRFNAHTWSKVAMVGIRGRAKNKGLEVNITHEDLAVPDICPVLGIPIILSKNAPRGNRPSVDRFDNSLGYAKGNVRVISSRANNLKNDATVDEIERILRYMKGEVS